MTQSNSAKPQDALDIALQSYVALYAHFPTEIKEQLIADLRKAFTAKAENITLNV